jgi:hypothetical protein
MKGQSLNPLSTRRAGRGTRHSGRWLYLIAGLLLVVGLLTACAQQTPPAAQQPEPTVVTQVEPTKAPPTEAPKPTEPPAPPPVQEEPVVAEPVVTYDLQAITAAWEGSPHGNTYDIGKGPNTYCSRCHSPQNWDPASKTDRPPNCVTCKFDFDEEIRQASTMAFVEEKDWKGIGCETCHPVVDGVVQPELAWLNSVTMEHEPVNTSNELCQKCHVDTKGVAVTGGTGVSHGIILGGSAHLNWAGQLPQGHRPSYCSDCHDPHSAQPKQCVDCHEDVLTSETHMKGLSAEHANVTCMACHDASGLSAGPNPDGGEDAEFVTLGISGGGMGGGEPTTAYVHSHSIQWQVDCSRCHFEENPWELPVLDAKGNPPGEAPASGRPGN